MLLNLFVCALGSPIRALIKTANLLIVFWGLVFSHTIGVGVLTKKKVGVWGFGGFEGRGWGY